MGTNTQTGQPRRDRLVRERVHDPLTMKAQPKEGALCPECGLVFSTGRWKKSTLPPAKSYDLTCAACHRIKENYPAGEVLLSGSFVPAHREEIASLVRNVEKAETGEHPLNRVMAIEDTDEGLRITTTDIHLPHRIGRAVDKAWKGGSSSEHFDDSGYFARVTWHRD